jgi:phosphate:Na+ symporter
MHFSLILLHLAGAIVLLLYAVHLVRNGMERGHADALRRLLGEAKGGAFRAAAGGAAMAVMLQSSTAVAMLACGFAASGVLAVPVGLALLLGADLGSALVVRVLTFDLGWLAPVCLAFGGLLHLKATDRRARETGRMILGVGFVLLSLELIGAATGPLREGAMLPMVSAYLEDDYLTGFLLGAAFAWLIHSSVAAVLLVATFATQGLISLEAGATLVLGANLGGGLIAFWLSRGMPAQARRIPTGNLVFRAAGAAIALLAIEMFDPPLDALAAGPGSALVNFHVAFNACLVLACLPLSGAMARLTRSLLPDPAAAEGNLFLQRVSALDRSVLGNPELALASVTRELLRMGEIVESMIRPVMDLFASCKPQEIARARALEDEVDRATTDVKLYIAEMNRGELTPGQMRRGIELTDVAINLEHAADVVVKDFLVLAAKCSEKNLKFSEEGWSELTALHARVAENIRLALNVLVSNDLPSARQLVVEKERMRALERESHDRHLHRLQSGTLESIETSDIHLETVRALKEINSLLVTIAYPILMESGDLLESRLTRIA